MTQHWMTTVDGDDDDEGRHELGLAQRVWTSERSGWWRSMVWKTRKWKLKCRPLLFKVTSWQQKKNSTKRKSKKQSTSTTTTTTTKYYYRPLYYWISDPNGTEGRKRKHNRRVRVTAHIQPAADGDCHCVCVCGAAPTQPRLGAVARLGRKINTFFSSAVA